MSRTRGFGIWITGIPSSGKTTLVRSVVTALHQEDIWPVVLESDILRRILTPEPTYRPEERDRFYRQLTDIGALIVQAGAPVIFDATANRRAYRDRARRSIERFLEVLVECPVEECRIRDPKGVYAAAARGDARHVPGIQEPYEAPTSPELVVDGRKDPPSNASQVIRMLRERGYI